MGAGVLAAAVWGMDVTGRGLHGCGRPPAAFGWLRGARWGIQGGHGRVKVIADVGPCEVIAEDIAQKTQSSESI